MTNEAGSLTGELKTAAEATADVAQTAYYDTLVGDGKKYSGDDANEKLATAYYNADRRIEELKGDLAAKEQNETLLNEVLSELRNSSGSHDDDDAPVHNAPVDQVHGTEDIAKIVKGVLDVERSTTEAKTNTAKTLKKLTEVYGSERDALAAVDKVVNGDNNIERILNDMGNVNPEAAVKFVTGTVPLENPPGSNTPGIDGGSADVIASSTQGLTWTQCCDLRRKDPREYNSPTFRKRMEQATAAAESRGEDFFAT